MESWFLDNANIVRLSIFLGAFFVFGILEMIIPDHKPPVPKKDRWISNILLILLNSITLKIIFPFSAIFLAVYISKNKIGLLNNLDFPFYLKIALAIVILDFIIYIQHIIFHHVSFLWKFHRVHHADLELDVTSGTRFHPIEIIISMVIKFGAIYILGASALSVLLFEIILNAMAMFNHSNIKIYKPIEDVLGYFIITPSLHRIHHSIRKEELNSNFGFNISIWDRWFKTFRIDYSGKLVIGLENFREIKYSNLINLLTIPFIKEENNEIKFINNFVI